MRARRLLGAAALATLGAALWWRKNPSACPYGQRFWVQAPHPIISRERLRRVNAWFTDDKGEPLQILPSPAATAALRIQKG